MTVSLLFGNRIRLPSDRKLDDSVRARSITTQPRGNRQERAAHWPCGAPNSILMIVYGLRSGLD
jgi:hypothetical protein